MLGKLQSSHATVVPTLVARLKDERAIVRAESADALAMFGTAASEAETALRIAENDHYLTVRVAAEDALIAIHK